VVTSGDPRSALGERLTAAGVTRSQRELAWVILAYVDYDTGRCAKPSRTTLATCTGRSPRSVWTDLQALVAAGILAATERPGVPTVYDITEWRAPAQTELAPAAEVAEDDLVSALAKVVPARLWDGAHRATMRAECERLAGLGWTPAGLAAAGKRVDWPRIHTGGGVVTWIRDRQSPPHERPAVVWCGACVRGWLPDDRGEASERPCPACRPEAGTARQGALWPRVAEPDPAGAGGPGDPGRRTPAEPPAVASATAARVVELRDAVRRKPRSQGPQQPTSQGSKVAESQGC
jgi:hypothetical protein